MMQMATKPGRAVPDFLEARITMTVMVAKLEPPVLDFSAVKIITIIMEAKQVTAVREFLTNGIIMMTDFAIILRTAGL